MVNIFFKAGVIRMWMAFKGWLGGINWWVVAAIAAVLLVSNAVTWIYGAGEASGRGACAEGAVANIEQKGAEHAKIESLHRSLSDDRRDDEYSRWVQSF